MDSAPSRSGCERQATVVREARGGSADGAIGSGGATGALGSGRSAGGGETRGGGGGGGAGATGAILAGAGSGGGEGAAQLPLGSGSSVDTFVGAGARGGTTEGMPRVEG